MPDVPFIHKATLTSLDAAITGKPHALLLHGQDGVSFEQAIDYIAAKMNVIVHNVMPAEGNDGLSVSDIRALYELTHAVTRHTRVFVLKNAEALSPSAQNALLKLLEEPFDHYMFILQSSHPEQLLPTVRSRAQAIEVRPITAEQSNELLDKIGVTYETTRTQLLFIAEGLTQQLTTLARDPAAQAAQIQLVKHARSLLQGELYEKLQIIDSYKDDRFVAKKLVFFVGKLLRQSLIKSPSPSALQKLSLLVEASEALETNANVRLTLCRIVV